MIHVSKDQLVEVEYLLGQSAQGNHVLFNADTVRRVFEKASLLGRPDGLLLSDEEAYSVEHHIERMIEQPTLELKRAYIEGLDELTYERVVLAYFNIVENNLFENTEVRH